VDGRGELSDGIGCLRLLRPLLQSVLSQTDRQTRALSAPLRPSAHLDALVSRAQLGVVGDDVGAAVVAARKLQAQGLGQVELCLHGARGGVGREGNKGQWSSVCLTLQPRGGRFPPAAARAVSCWGTTAPTAHCQRAAAGNDDAGEGIHAPR
jgi:hypothetical protein